MGFDALSNPIPEANSPQQHFISANYSAPIPGHVQPSYSALDRQSPSGLLTTVAVAPTNHLVPQSHHLSPPEIAPYAPHPSQVEQGPTPWPQWDVTRDYEGTFIGTHANLSPQNSFQSQPQSAGTGHHRPPSSVGSAQHATTQYSNRGSSVLASSRRQPRKYPSPKASRTEADDRSGRCKCNPGLNRGTRLERHLEFNKEPWFECLVCPATTRFTSIDAWVEHVKYEASNDLKKAFEPAFEHERHTLGMLPRVSVYPLIRDFFASNALESGVDPRSPGHTRP